MTAANIGIMIEGQDGLNWERWQRIVLTVEDAGYQCLFRSDHFTNASGPHKDALELWTSLTWLADHTEHIEFGPLVTPITFRHPAMITQYAAAIDTLSDGRFLLGMGTGWQDREHREFGIEFPPLSERYERLQDGLEIATRLFGNDEPISYAGKHYALDGALLTMKRKDGPRILIGGNGPNKTLPLAAKYATEWNAVYITRALYQERHARMVELLDAEGRSQDEMTYSLMTRVVYGKDEAALQQKLAGITNVEGLRERDVIIGTGQAVIDQIGAWTELGVQRFMLQWIELDDTDGMEAMASDVLPHFHV